jgi:hypothetical protein
MSLASFRRDLRDVFKQARQSTPLEALKMFIDPKEFGRVRRSVQPRVKVRLQCRGVHLDFDAR